MMLPLCRMLQERSKHAPDTLCSVLCRPRTGEQGNFTATLWVGCRSLWMLQHQLLHPLHLKEPPELVQGKLLTCCSGRLHSRPQASVV